MGRKRNLTIKEDISELKSYKTKTLDYNSSKRLEALILLKSNEYKTLEATAEHLGVNYTTLCKWIKRYKDKGIDGYLAKFTTSKESKIITKEAHEALEKRLHDENNPFSGYAEVQQWLRDGFGIEIEYQWLWKYMRTKLNSRLKVPRKVNVKKEEGAEASFLKNAVALGTY